MPFDVNQDAYRDFRDIVAERSDAVVAWVGAGLSRPAGLPTWDGLQQSLIQSLQSRAQSATPSQDQQQYAELAAKARASTTPWDAFSLLKQALGIEEYRASVRRALSAGESAPVPQAYKLLWRLGVSGVLNLNLDRLAARAFNEVSPQKTLHTFSGKRAGDYLHLFRSAKPWMAYLHGEIDETSSWVFTASELRDLLSSTGYKTLLTSCFAARTLLFLGISADDIAAGGQLEALTRSGVDLGGHYWLTHRSDAATRQWASNAGLRLITYHAEDDDHSPLLDFLNDLRTYVPADTPAAPVRPRVIQSSAASLPTPGRLRHAG